MDITAFPSLRAYKADHSTSRRYNHRNLLYRSTMSFALQVPSPKPRALPLDWPILSRLASQTVIMRETYHKLVAHCDSDCLPLTAAMTRPPYRSDHARLLNQLGKIAAQLDKEFPAPVYTPLSPVDPWLDLRRVLKGAIQELVHDVPPARLTSTELLFSLPYEVYDVIIGYLPVPDSTEPDLQHKRFLSDLSLMSHSWAHLYRPPLFQSLSIQSSADIQVLYNILRSPLSKHLSHGVQSISIRTQSFSLATILLLNVLPALRTLRLSSLDAGQRPPNMPPFPLLTRLGLSKLGHLTTLALARCSFRSFWALLLLVKAVPSLEEVDLLDVYWRVSNITPEQLPPCAITFSAMRRVTRTTTTDTLVPGFSCWPLGWILAAPACGHRYQRRRSNGVQESCQAVRIVMQMVAHFCDGLLELDHSFQSTLREDEEGEYILYNGSLTSTDILRPCLGSRFLVVSTANQAFPELVLQLDTHKLPPAPFTSSICQAGEFTVSAVAMNVDPSTGFDADWWSELDSLQSTTHSLHSLTIVYHTPDVSSNAFHRLFERLRDGMPLSRPMLSILHRQDPRARAEADAPPAPQPSSETSPKADRVRTPTRPMERAPWADDERAATPWARKWAPPMPQGLAEYATP